MDAPASLYLRFLGFGLAMMIIGRLLVLLAFDRGLGAMEIWFPWVLATVFGIQAAFRKGFEAGRKKVE